MKNELHLLVLLSFVVLAILLVLPGCRNGVNSSPINPVGSSTTSAITNNQIFRSDKFYLTVSLPQDWAGVEGSELLAPKTLSGDVAFNSWGQADFWIRAQTLNHSAADNPTPVISYTYGRETVASQVKDGGAYVALVEIDGPPMDPGTEPQEYTPNDLSGLVNPHDWRQDASSSAQFFSFYKWGRSWRLEIACKADASDDTVAALNDLLESWKFDEVPAGDPGWAFTVARQLLPDEVVPKAFSSQTSLSYDQTVARNTQVDVLQDKTVHFRFTYYWNLPATPIPGKIDTPSETYHWWEIDVLPSGEAILLAQGGTPLPAQ